MAGLGSKVVAATLGGKRTLACLLSTTQNGQAYGPLAMQSVRSLACRKRGSMADGQG